MKRFIRLLKRIARVLFISVCVLVMLVVLHINIKLHHRTEIETFDHEPINVSLVHQLNYLEFALSENAAHDMQQLFPEGFVFMHALYGLAWHDLAANHPSAKLRLKAIEQIKNSYLAIDGPFGTRPFQEELPIKYGAFYSGWKNYLLGKLLSLQHPADRDSALVAQFKSDCQKIAGVLDHETFPESYSEMRWPADGMVATASVALHDKIFTAQYQGTIKNLLNRIRTGLDSNGLIPHRCDASGNVIESARGSSQSLTLNFLAEVDSAFAQEQFERYREKFLDDHLGLCFIREYPKGEAGDGDIDSGPVVWDIGSAATIVGLRTLRIFNHNSHASSINQCIETFGFPSDTEHGKRYLFGQLVMADAFIAWVKSSKSALKKDNEKPWPLKFHGYSLLLLAMLISAIIWSWPRKM